MEERRNALVPQVSWAPLYHPNSLQWFKDSIIEPLSHVFRAMGLQLRLPEVEHAMRSGKLLNYREAEIVLTREARVRSLTPSAYGVANNLKAQLGRRPDAEILLTDITTFFDSALQDNSWRDRYYDVALTGAMATAHESSNFERRTSTTLGQPASMNSDTSRALAMAPTEHLRVATPGVSTNLENLSQLNASEGQLYNSTITTDTTTSNLSSASEFALLSNDWTVCPYSGCGQRINTQNPHDRKKNFKRHWKHTHGKVQPQQCHICGRAIGRRDNLKRHIMNDHLDS